MKYIYIAGLEHSGTTLLTQSLCCQSNILGLGEVVHFFSPHHMAVYMDRWKGTEDVNLCSCGETWNKCTFWGELQELNGLNSDMPLISKYRILLNHVRKTMGDDVVIVDSSKHFYELKSILDGKQEIGLANEDILVVLAVKDVRSFAKSIVQKQQRHRDVKTYTSSIFSLIRVFNWWKGANESFINYLQDSDVNFSVSLYEEFCRNPEEAIEAILNQCVDYDKQATGEFDLVHNSAHIVRGNKDFTMRNRKKIIYDSRWFIDDNINLIYLLHWRARALNKQFYKY